MTEDLVMVGVIWNTTLQTIWFITYLYFRYKDRP